MTAAPHYEITTRIAAKPAEIAAIHRRTCRPVGSQKSAICRDKSDSAASADPLAMQKVEGSSPFSRSSRSPANRGVFLLPDRVRRRMRVVVQQLCTTNGALARLPAGGRGAARSRGGERCEAGDRNRGGNPIAWSDAGSPSVGGDRDVVRAEATGMCCGWCTACGRRARCGLALQLFGEHRREAIEHSLES